MINAETTLTWGSESFAVFDGSIVMQAQDGWLLYQNASPYVDPDNFWALFVDYDHIAADGEQAQLQKERYEYLFGYSDTGSYIKRVGRTVGLNCPDLFSE